MSAPAQASTATSKATDEKKHNETMKEQQKPNMALEEDDEFEDFPVEGIRILTASILVVGFVTILMLIRCHRVAS
jgi:hypothetical protein